MLTGFDKYNAEVDVFIRSKLYDEKYHEVVGAIRFHLIDNPVLSPDLCKRFHLNDNGVQVRKIVQNARRLGVPIGSKSDGYFLARNQRELNEGNSHLRERMNSLQYTIDRLDDVFATEQVEMAL